MFFSIGECLIDFIPKQRNCELKDVLEFIKKPGGAPANVCACVSKLGNDAYFIGKLGEDAFGDFLVESMEAAGIKTDYVSRTTEANTALAFVSLQSDGQREFSFYRKPSADMLLQEDEISSDWFQPNDFLHFCSVDLIEAPVKYAHKKAIEFVKERGGTIVFDPNLRFPLWDDLEELKKTVNEFIKYADIVKISDEELKFITGTNDEEVASKILFQMGVKVFIYTMGREGAKIFTNRVSEYVNGFSVDVIDTTGAGDAFIGAFVGKMIRDNKTIYDIDNDNDNGYAGYAKDLLIFSNACGALVSSREGALSSMPDVDEIRSFIDGHL